MPILSDFRSLFSLPEDKPDLILAQALAFSRQVPLLYFILLANTLALSLTHFGSAPVYLTIYLPGVLGGICLLRLFMWWTNRDHRMTLSRAKRLLRATTPLAGILGAAFSLWALSLVPYGDAYQQSHVAFYMGITSIACIFCLMHLRSAALVLSGIVVIPMVGFFVQSGQPVFIAISFNLLLVTGAMIAVLLRHYREFTDLIAAKKALLVKNADTQQLSDENLQLANLDPLTELPNRRNFLDVLRDRLAESAREETSFVVGVVDLDGFKPVNDAFGHAAGDRLLVQVAERMRSFRGGMLFAARLGGDEFGIIFGTDLDAGQIQAAGEDLCHELGQPYVLPGAIAPVTASLGLCRYPECGITAEELFERADYALYHAKAEYRGSAVQFSQDHARRIEEVAKVETVLRLADFERELSVVFQPIVDVEAGRTIAFETLARWHNDDLGSIPPDQFIPAAERLGIVSRLTGILARKTLEVVATWPVDLRVSMNLSAQDLASDRCIDDLIALVKASGIAPERIDFEITETALFNDFKQANKALEKLRDIGVTTSLDDFGTGYSSLSHVRQLPFDRIKIDRSFVAEMEDHRASRDIVKAVLDLSRNLRIDCVVEGVETESQVTAIRHLGGNLMQGYWFARPMAREQIKDYLIGEHLKALRSIARSGEEPALNQTG